MNRILALILMLIQLQVSLCGKDIKPDWQTALMFRVREFESATKFGVFEDAEIGTVAEKLADFQNVIKMKSGYPDIPIFLTPRAARIPVGGKIDLKGGDTRTNAPLNNVTVKDCLLYLCSLLNLKIQIADKGVFISHPDDRISFER